VPGGDTNENFNFLKKGIIRGPEASKKLAVVSPPLAKQGRE